MFPVPKDAGQIYDNFTPCKHGCNFSKFELADYHCMDMRKVLGHNIRFMRESRGYSQKSFAAKSGFKRTYIGAIERGETNVTLSNLCQIADALGIHPGILLMRDAFKNL